MTGSAARPVTLAMLPHLRRARDHMDRHYREPLDLDRLAAVAAVSKSHLVRSFEATYGETPIRYRTRRRIERAQDLLRAANLTSHCCANATTGSSTTRNGKPECHEPGDPSTPHPATWTPTSDHAPTTSTTCLD